MNAKKLSGPARLTGLDGLRAVAVVSVIAYHFLPEQVVGGYIGVDLFFVISGFLITGLLVRERNSTGTIEPRRFWIRRARRLIPALGLVVLVCSALAFVIGGDVIVRIGSQVLGAATFSSNWIFIAQGSNYFTADTPELFRNLWSLAVEEQFYLLWPLILLGLLFIPARIARISIVGALAVASAAAMAFLPAEATRLYYGTDTHSFGLALGAALAIAFESRFTTAPTPPSAWVRRVLPIVGVVALVDILVIAALMHEDDPGVTQGGLAVVAALTAIVIAASTMPGSWLGRALDVQPMKWIGERSYGLYLWHWPLLVLFAEGLPRSTPWWAAPALALVTTVGAATLSYKYIEMPVRTRGFRGALAAGFGERAALVPVSIAGVVALIVAGGLTIAGAATDPGKSEAQLAIEYGQQAIRDATPVRTIYHEQEKVVQLPGGDQISAVGDSVMLAAAPILQATFPGIQIDAAVSRPMLMGPVIVQALKDSDQLRPVLVVGLGTNGPIDDEDLDALVRIAGPKTLIVLVNAQAPRDWIPGVNAQLQAFARTERNVEIANWHDAIAGRIDELADDEVHPGGPITQGVYVGSIADALQRLAELPPLVTNPWVNRAV